MVIDRPPPAVVVVVVVVMMVVHRWRSGQPAHAAPKVTVRVLVIWRECPAGQVTVPCCSSMVKSRVNPPSTAGRSDFGLITVSCPASRQAARASPLP